MKKEELVLMVGITDDLKGGFKLRWSNDTQAGVTKRLTKHGCSVISFIDLDGEFTKQEAAEILKDHPEFQSPDYQEVINTYLSKELKSAKPKAEKKVKTEPKNKSSGLSELDAKALEQAIASLEKHLDEA